MNYFKRARLLALTTCLLLATAFAAIQVAEAQTYNVIHDFSGLDGGSPYTGVIADSAGNLYGVAGGGSGTNCNGYGCGVIYKMTNAGGSWSEQIIYQFVGTDGEFQYGPAALDSDGNVFTTAASCTSGCDGTVVETSPRNGGWVGTVLHRFTGQPDGSSPLSGLLFDSGTLYGTAATSGLYYGGSVFTLSGTGYTDYSQVYSFTGNLHVRGETAPSYGSLARDGNGNLYGTTLGDIVYHYPSVFEMSPDGRGGWNETLLHRFGQWDLPQTGVVIGPDGNLYGTLYSSSESNNGVVYQLVHNSNGTWTYNVIYAFQAGSDGNGPGGAPTFDAAGHLYGTTVWGGNGYGTVYELTPSGPGQWTETVLHRFTDRAFGANPAFVKLWLDNRGHIYGTTQGGGSHNDGTVFEITP